MCLNVYGNKVLGHFLRAHDFEWVSQSEKMEKCCKTLIFGGYFIVGSISGKNKNC